ncbi:MAG: type II toxin-antitoxin system RelE/ParE family toxin [Thermovirgaceae bacterium]|nr:type II toxin-antitoxin system RelE/ParE family toxin [Thermovirgaceae bacterium]
MIRMIQTETYKKWEEKLRDRGARKIITARLFRLADGLSGDVSPVGDGISELRIHYGPGYRIYFQQKENVLIILLCGGDKSTQNEDIQRAKDIVKELEAN